MTAPYRVIVTGSRYWGAPSRVSAALDNVHDQLAPGQSLTVVHGACRIGADVAAHLWCLRRQSAGDAVTEEPHPADWRAYARAAGPIRNQHMVDLGADLVLAFLLNDSRGTRDCIRRARAVGIPVREVTP